jgi:hypothetical protein
MVYATTSRMPQRCRYLVALGFRGGDLGYLKYLGSTKSFYLHSLYRPLLVPNTTYLFTPYSVVQ